MQYAKIDTAIAGKPMISGGWTSYFTEDETSCVIEGENLNAGFLIRDGVTELSQTAYDTERLTHTKELANG